MLLQITMVLKAFKDFLEDFGSWADEIIKRLDEHGVCTSLNFFSCNTQMKLAIFVQKLKLIHSKLIWMCEIQNNTYVRVYNNRA